jgi:hypothetical protein
MSSQRIRQRSLLAKLGAGGALIAASVIAGPSGSAEAASGENPPAGLLAKIQIATQATNTNPASSKALAHRTKRPKAAGKSKQIHALRTTP